MIREGWASLVTKVGDILDVWGETGKLLRADVAVCGVSRDEGPVFAQDLSEAQRRIGASLDELRALDQISFATGLSIRVIQSDLTLDEIRSLIEKFGALFSRSR